MTPSSSLETRHANPSSRWYHYVGCEPTLGAGDLGAEPAATGPGGGGGAMAVPAPVSGEGYSMGFTSETRSNYLRGGLIFSTAYDSDATTGSNGQPTDDVSYSIWPTISLDQTRSRLHWVLTYSPGSRSTRRQASSIRQTRTLNVDLKYRLSPHMTFSLRDSFQKTSNILNQPNSDLARRSPAACLFPTIL